MLLVSLEKKTTYIHQKITIMPVINLKNKINIFILTHPFLSKLLFSLPLIIFYISIAPTTLAAEKVPPEKQEDDIHPGYILIYMTAFIVMFLGLGKIVFSYIFQRKYDFTIAGVSRDLIEQFIEAFSNSSTVEELMANLLHFIMNVPGENLKTLAFHHALWGGFTVDNVPYERILKVRQEYFPFSELPFLNIPDYHYYIEKTLCSVCEIIRKDTRTDPAVVVLGQAIMCFAVVVTAASYVRSNISHEETSIRYDDVISVYNDGWKEALIALKFIVDPGT